MKTRDIENVTHPTDSSKQIRLGWSSSEKDSISNILNELLANYSVHYQKLRNFHWNVKGADFFDLHEQFEVLYTEARDNIDEIAERIRVFGKTPLSTLQDYLNVSSIKETGTELASDAMVKEVLADYRILLERMFSVVDVATGHHDSGTEEMVKAYINSIEKHHWMLTAFLTK
jgi:starvation-inducible DNA-binding protein